MHDKDAFVLCFWRLSDGQSEKIRTFLCVCPLLFFRNYGILYANAGKGGADMPEEVMLREMKMLARRTVFLNIAAYLVSVIVLGATLSFAAGLLLGSAVLFCSLFLLRYSVLRMAEEAKRTGIPNRRRYRFFYALRLFVFAAAFGTAVIFRRYISPAAVAVPMLYPRLVYTAGAIFTRSTPDSGQKKR